MSVKGVFTFVQDAAHAILPLAGIATASAAVIAVFVNKFGVPQDLTLGAIAGVGSAATAVSKWIDSASFTRLESDSLAWESDLRKAAIAAGKGDVVDAVKDVVNIAQAPPA